MAFFDNEFVNRNNSRRKKIVINNIVGFFTVSQYTVVFVCFVTKKIETNYKQTCNI